jgi:predicted nucleotidyltransferase
MRGSKEAKKLAPDEKQKLKITTEDPELADRFNRVLGDVVEALQETQIRYAFIGGIASGGLGRPRSTHDIDLFVPPEEAEITLRALAKRGFTTDKTDPSWLYKAFKENILVDVIFKSKGEIYLDNEMYARTITAEFHGQKLRLVAPEDLLIIKAVAHSELCPNHWHDATALLSHASLDWGYLIKRARRAPRRVLSLLLYAQSNDIWVPNNVIHELYSGVFGDFSRNINGGVAHSKAPELTTQPHAPREIPKATVHPIHAAAGNGKSSALQGGHALKTHHEYAVSHLRECLAEDTRTNELDIQIDYAGNKLLLRGEVTGVERREAVQQIARECFPDAVIENQIRILSFQEPVETEDVQ